MSCSGESSSSGIVVLESLPALPHYLLEDILNRLEDAKDLTNAQSLCREWRDAGNNVRSLRIICLDEYHERARNNSSFGGKSFKLLISDGAGSSTSGSLDEYHGRARNDSSFGEKSFKLLISDGAGSSTSGSLDEYHGRARNDSSFGEKSFKLLTPDGAGPITSGSFGGKPRKLLIPEGAGPNTPRSSNSSLKLLRFTDLVVEILKPKHCIVQLRIEVEAKLQSKFVTEDERRRTDFWLTDPYFLDKWLPRLGATLQHLCIVDYGQQAIMRRSRIFRILSESCPHLKTLDLRNLFIDTSECKLMPNMASLTLRCAKVVGPTLQHLNDIMPNLQTLALLGVFGAEGGILKFQRLKVLCLGLSTPANDVMMDCPNLEKLQLKMQCPQKLIIIASNLKYVAFNLDVMEPSKVELRSIVGIRELLYGAASFITLIYLLEVNRRFLAKLFLDIPCMALAEDGKFLGVLKDIVLVLPSFSQLHECEKLEVLNIGPGLWYSLETQVQELSAVEKWPSMKTLILHMIPHDMEAALTVLRTLLRTSVNKLDIFIHTSSPMTQELMTPEIEKIVDSSGRDIHRRIFSWQKSLDFSCFSF